jgi:LEA14-like dessication related protein
MNYDPYVQSVQTGYLSECMRLNEQPKIMETRAKTVEFREQTELVMAIRVVHLWGYWYYIIVEE